MMRSLCLLLLLSLARPAAAETLTVFAAASLKSALDTVAQGFEAARDDEVRLSYGASSVMARQVQVGAPADVVILANRDWMDLLERRGAVDAETRVDLLTNRLVLVAAGTDAAPVTLDDDSDLPARLGEGRLAMALVDAVPAGIYGRAALEHFGMWDRVAPRVAQADNVRAALALVAGGAAPFGIVYATDAAAEPRVSVVATFPEDSHPPIVYPAAATARGQPELAQAFLAWLRGPEARAAFEAAGFGFVRR